jgi:NAD(P)-dependent dehydrogenase (short-subunit alcohol dehydrogenase family)
MDLANRVALITGGKRIGGVVAEQLARGGADVALVYRSSRGEAEDAAAAVRGYGRNAVVMQADLRDPDACARVVDQTVDGLGRLDILVNMASAYRAVAFDDLTTEDWNEPLEVDLRAAWLCAQAAVPYMRRLRGGRIVNISDWVAASGRPRYPRYLPPRRSRSNSPAIRVSSTRSRPARSWRPKARRSANSAPSSAPLR